MGALQVLIECALCAETLAALGALEALGAVLFDNVLLTFYATREMHRAVGTIEWGLHRMHGNNVIAIVEIAGKLGAFVTEATNQVDFLR